MESLTSWKFLALTFRESCFSAPPPFPLPPRASLSCLIRKTKIIMKGPSHQNEFMGMWLHVTIRRVQFVIFNPKFYVSTQLNSLVDWTQLVKSYNLIQLLLSEYLSKIESNFQFLVPTNYLDSGDLPFISTWKMVKDAHNNIPMSIIG